MGIEAKKKEVLKFDYWSCNICGDMIDAGTAVGSDEFKTQVLVKHIKSHHFDNPALNPNLKDEDLVLYFKGAQLPKTRENEKLI